MPQPWSFEGGGYYHNLHHDDDDDEDGGDDCNDDGDGGVEWGRSRIQRIGIGRNRIAWSSNS